MNAILKILATLGLVCLNGCFVAAEFSAVGSRASRLRTGTARALPRRAALFIKSRLDLFLSSCQFGNTLASLALGALTAPAVATLLAPLMDAVPLSDSTRRAMAFIFSFAIAATLQIVIGEQVAKNLALAHCERVLAFMAIPLVIFTAIFYPGIWALNAATRLVLRGIGVRPSGADGDVPTSEPELRDLLMHAAAAGAITPGKALLLTNAMELDQLKVRQIMTPRPEVDFLLVDQPIDATLRTVQRSAYTRLPLCEIDLDHVLGQVHMKDLFNHLQLVPGKLKFLDGKSTDGQCIVVPSGQPGSAVHVIGTGEINLRLIKRPMMFVPELMSVSRLLRQFQTKHQHMAVVVDEYGSTRGIVTMEDVLEEIVGQIEDEFDPVQPTDLVREGAATRVNGRMPLHELLDRLPLGPLHAEGVDTVGGYLVWKLNHWPRPGDEVEIGGWKAKVLSVQQRRVCQVLLTPPAAAETEKM